MKYSFIIPVYNRPDEVDELLQSLTEQELKDFEVVIVEDGSQKPCKDVCDKFTEDRDRPATTEPSAPMANGSSFWIPMSCCPKAT